jgi:hypothetical protein
MLGPHTLLNLSTKHENKTYYQIDNRDSLNSNLIVESVFLFGANRIGLAATAEYESAQDDIYSGCHKYVPIAIFLTDGTAMCNGLKL